jgi:hypothetical protein
VLSDRIEGSTQNPQKIIGALNFKSTNQNERFPNKKYFLYLKNVKEPKIRMGATRRNLQARPKILKKIVGKIFPKISIFNTLKM